MKDTNHPPLTTQSKLPTLEIEYEHYQQFLENADLSEDEKKEFIDTLWSIIVSFVDLGFGIHPVQQASDDSITLDEILASMDEFVLEPNKNNKKHERSKS